MRIFHMECILFLLELKKKINKRMCGDNFVASFIGPTKRRAFVEPAHYLTPWLIKTRLQPKSAFVDFFERMVVKQAKVNLTTH